LYAAQAQATERDDPIIMRHVYDAYKRVSDVCKEVELHGIAARAAAPADHPLTTTPVVDHKAAKVSDKPVAYLYEWDGWHQFESPLYGDPMPEDREWDDQPPIFTTPLYASPPRSAEWVAEAMRLADLYAGNRACRALADVSPVFDRAETGDTMDAARAALEAHMKGEQ
jgi:hypothetical protein